mmetsp:Transcript_11580/g.13396  ORF Transcript_11580/g.13396 Transcript_11580/m.13396 type:complete len:948 (+) Transcript_11580:322-3165(+)
MASLSHFFPLERVDLVWIICFAQSCAIFLLMLKLGSDSYSISSSFLVVPFSIDKISPSGLLLVFVSLFTIVLAQSRPRQAKKSIDSFACSKVGKSDKKNKIADNVGIRLRKGLQSRSSNTLQNSISCQEQNEKGSSMHKFNSNDSKLQPSVRSKENGSQRLLPRLSSASNVHYRNMFQTDYLGDEISSDESLGDFDEKEICEKLETFPKEPDKEAEQCISAGSFNLSKSNVSFGNRSRSNCNNSMGGSHTRPSFDLFSSGMKEGDSEKQSQISSQSSLFSTKRSQNLKAVNSNSLQTPLTKAVNDLQKLRTMIARIPDQILEDCVVNVNCTRQLTARTIDGENNRADSSLSQEKSFEKSNRRRWDASNKSKSIVRRAVSCVVGNLDSFAETNRDVNLNKTEASCLSANQNRIFSDRRKSMIVPGQFQELPQRFSPSLASSPRTHFRGSRSSLSTTSRPKKRSLRKCFSQGSNRFFEESKSCASDSATPLDIIDSVIDALRSPDTLMRPRLHKSFSGDLSWFAYNGFDDYLQDDQMKPENLDLCDGLLGHSVVQKLPIRVRRRNTPESKISIDVVSGFCPEPTSLSISDELLVTSTIDELPAENDLKTGNPEAPENNFGNIFISHASDSEMFNNVKMNLGKWDTDIFAIAENTGERPLGCLFSLMLRERDYLNHFNISESRLFNFCTAIENGYDSELPYHNSIHAADVLNSAYHILVKLNLSKNMSKLQCLAGLFAAAIHDLGHPGRTAKFLVETKNELALLYNDESILEQYHSAEAFRILMDPDRNIVINLPEEKYCEFRKLVIHAVQATDLSKHYKAITKIKSLDVKSLYEVSDDPAFLLEICIKVSDIGHAGKAWDLHKVWSMRIQDEFFLQGDEEKKLGMKVSPFMDRHCPRKAANQAGFFRYIAKPLYDAIYTVFPPFGAIQSQANNNYLAWQQFLRASQKQE